MLCMVTGTVIPGLPIEQSVDNMKLFPQWTPPTGFNIKAMYFSVSNAFLLVDVETSAACYEALETWAGFYQFQVIPVVEAPQMMQLSQKVVDWRNKVLGG
jgi:hypothetical protein